MQIKDIRQINGLSLAYLGDAAWEIVIREYLVANTQLKPNELHKYGIQFAKASGQAAIVTALLDQELLSDDEVQAFKRGRNMKSHTSAKNASIADYRLATGFEALCGYLYLQDDHERFHWVTQFGLKFIEENERGQR